MPDLAWLNGQWGPLEEACIPVRDRGAMFGDGIYEVLRSYEGRLWAVEPHLRRLDRSLRAIGLLGILFDRTEFDGLSMRQLLEEANRRSGYRNSRVYVQVTRGIAPRAHVFPDPNDVPPSVMVTVEEQADL